MTVTCRDIVRRALRKLSRVAAGTEPNAQDMNDGLETLQAIYLELVGLGVFGRMYETVVTTATYNALPQQRIVGNVLGGVTVTLPTLVDPASCSLGNGLYDYGFRNYYLTGTVPLPPMDGACIQTTDLFSNDQETWIYESSTARWIQLEALNPNNVAPLGARYSEGLACMLAARIAPEYGVQTPPSVEKGAANGCYALTHRYDSRSTPNYTEYF